MEETFEEYLERLKKFRDEFKYGYTDKDFEDHIDYIKECYETNLSVYKCIEFLYFDIVKIKKSPR